MIVGSFYFVFTVAFQLLFLAIIIYFLSVFPAVTNAYKDFKGIMDSQVCDPVKVGVVIDNLNKLTSKFLLSNILTPVVDVFVSEIKKKCPYYTPTP